MLIKANSSKIRKITIHYFWHFLTMKSSVNMKWKEFCLILMLFEKWISCISITWIIRYMAVMMIKSFPCFLGVVNPDGSFILVQHKYWEEFYYNFHDICRTMTYLTWRCQTSYQRKRKSCVRRIVLCNPWSHQRRLQLTFLPTNQIPPRMRVRSCDQWKFFQIWVLLLKIEAQFNFIFIGN